MRVLGLASYPVEAAATRYRLTQFAGPLAERGITLTIKPFLDSRLFGGLYQRRALLRTTLGLVKSALFRFKDLVTATRADVVLVQREAMMFGPPLFEWLVKYACRRPLVLDLDDATYVSYTSPTYGRLGKALKWFSKTDDLIRWSTIVTCGNGTIANYVESKGARAEIIPTVVNTDIFHPAPRSTNGPVVVGWIGTHSTLPYLESILPVLKELSRTHSFLLKVVGAGKNLDVIPGLEVQNVPWQLNREVADFQSLDIGLYPIDSSLYSQNWASGKSGFKAIQYMAVGIPYVATPVGAIGEIGKVGETHFCATTDSDWYNALAALIDDQQVRKRMGAAGRRHVVENYSLPNQVDNLTRVLREAVANRKSG
jgi:glycosyltransferase involved in cell wall biosynthesis